MKLNTQSTGKRLAFFFFRILSDMINHRKLSCFKLHPGASSWSQWVYFRNTFSLAGKGEYIYFSTLMQLCTYMDDMYMMDFNYALIIHICTHTNIFTVEYLHTVHSSYIVSVHKFSWMLKNLPCSLFVMKKVSLSQHSAKLYKKENQVWSVLTALCLWHLSSHPLRDTLLSSCQSLRRPRA